VFPLLLLGVYRLRFKRRHSVVLILVVALALIGFWTMHAIWRHYYG
jgi:peptidoglycan/LPS O-acetylase OafA/YrhL